MRKKLIISAYVIVIAGLTCVALINPLSGGAKAFLTGIVATAALAFWGCWNEDKDPYGGF